MRIHTINVKIIYFIYQSWFVQDMFIIHLLHIYKTPLIIPMCLLLISTAQLIIYHYNSPLHQKKGLKPPELHGGVNKLLLRLS